MRLLLILVLLQLPISSYAVESTGEVNPERATASEMLRLPELCQIRFEYGPRGKEFSKWKKILGPEYIHIHHYCKGLVQLMRLNKQKRHWKGDLNSAKKNFNYVISRVQNPKFVLLPDLYYRMAIIATEENNSPEAASFANKSIQAKKNYLNPYLLLADTYLKLGNREQAKQILLQAQKYHPNSKRLSSKLKQL
ncbi:MAG: tetratricopeptide repeat protein [Methyloprofundus sp.]|nr:tetratricopeptide repeat protein [Methyloprofundus sp.]